MNREELRAMNLSDEQINTIMAINGRDIENARQNTDSEALRTEQARREALQQQLDTALADMQAAQASAATAAELRRQLGEAQARIAAGNKANAIREALAKYKPRDAAMLARLLDNDKITLADDGTLTGLDEQVQPLKEGSAYLFADAPDSRGGSPDAGSAGKNIDMNAFLRG